MIVICSAFGLVWRVCDAHTKLILYNERIQMDDAI